jgi:carbamoyl-phosphate synthase large subunit
MQENVVGRYWCDDFSTIPPASSEDDYIDAMETLVASRDISVIIPSADAEFPVISRYKGDFLKRYGCHVLVNDPEEIARFSDKWLAAQWFNANDIPAPRTFLADNLQLLASSILKFSYPLILKPRIGGGSRYIFRVNSWDDIVRYQPTVPKPILQEYLLPDYEEYTAGTYKDCKDYVHVIILKRMLRFGMTNIAQTITDRPKLEDFCKEVVLKTNLKGSNNIQFRVTAGKPKVLEINPRFSGTTGIRAHCGFNDVEMWVTESMGLGKIVPPTIKKRHVLRYMEELYVE